MYTHISHYWGTKVHFIHTVELKLGTKCPLFIIICDVSDASSRAVCHRFVRWRIILFHIFTIGGILAPQFCTCINTNFSVEEDSLFAWSRTEIFYDSSKSYRTGFSSGLLNPLL